ncbi:MAG: ribonuclease H-like domain-containing protein [Verrucomicrobia bacterium]|nr:ribonuclease H-like domain-containing protein [Verrucomicrobiota bacterium]
MLRKTFCHVPGIGLKAEQRLWAAGVVSWDTLDAAGDALGARRREVMVRHVEESHRQLVNHNPVFFAETLPAREHWRLYSDFRDSVAYLDIETTGLGGPGDHITTIALYDGRTIRHYVHGRNLAEFARDVQGYKLLVTYNGKCFDLPILRTTFKMALDQPHIDLRYLLASLGYRGGLKGCERALGLDRGDLANVDGFFAVLLWHDFKRHRNPQALETLLAYNIRDVVNLEPLLVKAYNLKAAQTPFGPGVALRLPVPPPEPFHAHAPTVNRLLGEYFAPGSWSGG